MAIATIGLSDKELTAALDDLFAEGEAGARVRESTAYDLAAGLEKKPLVLFGAGQLGRMALAGLRKVGIEPVAFADNSPRLWNTRVDRVETLSPEDAAARYGGQANFVVTIWGGAGTERMAQREAHLRSLGCRNVISFQSLFWKHAELLLPHYGVDLPHKVHLQRDEVEEVGHMWFDDASRAEYLAQLRWRLLGDFDALPDPVAHATYFPADLCRLNNQEVFVDCGAYDGDTIQSFLEQTKNTFSGIYAFEPDPANFVRLQERLSLLPQHDSITLQCAAVGASAGSVTFSASGNQASHIGGSGMLVDLVKLDDVLSEANPTYIKMDIEGAELDALNGARGIIRRHSPVLAICTYHLQNHLWKIPLLIQSFSGEYNFFLRPHFLEGWDLVLYAIPNHRLAQR
jgi:FkbM family methyltransferase